MDQRTLDVMMGKEENYIFPFMWMHDGRRADLPHMIQQVYDSGVRALCVESRPHEHFCEAEWWADMDVVLSEAQKRDMKVWILDDKHFPTGFANGIIPQRYPKLRKWQLVEEHVDVVGPAPQSAVLLSIGTKLEDDCSAGCSGMTDVSDAEDILLGVYAYKRNEHEETLDKTPICLTDHVRGRYVFWDVPKGVYRVFALYKTRRGTNQKDYIHMIDRESVHALIEAVYEPHYQHYASYFGNTIVGFFSDEPSLGNARIIHGGVTPSMYDQKLGQPGLALPWTDQVLDRMNEALGEDVKPYLPGLWYKQGEGMPEVRLAYMDSVTTLWRENFSMQLGEWCRNHGVSYIGHIIEDMDAHMRLSCSGGHYFRSLAGQDMAGIDVVLHQIIPGIPHHIHAASCAGGMTDPLFFDYVLGRLAASLSHIEPRMRHRAMCEVFGAYGWAEGVPMMKHLADHMLVRGINHFVPHAFSPKYPDPDCPPHFNGGGLNPEFGAFSRLMKYINQTAHFIAGIETVSCAIVYPAEAEWSGMGSMSLRQPAKILYDQQLNYDILPIDTLMDASACVVDGNLIIGDMCYPALLVPYAAWLPKEFLVRLGKYEEDGLPVAFIEARPEGCTTGQVIPIHEIGDFVRQAGGEDVRLKESFPLLRIRHARRDGVDVFMLVNESLSDPFEGDIRFPVNGVGLRFDLQLDKTAMVMAENGWLRLKLGMGQSTVLVFGTITPAVACSDEAPARSELLAARWMLSLKPAAPNAVFSQAEPLDELYNVTGPQGNPDFSGTMRYETDFNAKPGLKRIDLGLVGECVRAELNGVDLGWRIDAPYVYDVAETIRSGENHLTLEIVNTLVHKHPDSFSHFVQISPSGLLGPVTLLYQGDTK